MSPLAAVAIEESRMRSLRARLNTAFVLPTALIVIVLVAVAYVAARQGLEGELAKRLEEVAQVIAVDMSNGIDAAQISRLDESMHRVRGRLVVRLQSVRDATEVRRIFIFDEEARSLVDTDEDTGFGERLYRIQADRAEVARTFDEGVATTGPLFQTDSGAFHKIAYAPITYEGETVAAIGVEASATYFDTLTRFASVLTLLGALGVMVVVGIGFWFSRLLVRPVDTLVDAAERLAEGDLETPVVIDQHRRWARTEELDFLMGSFEEMRQAIVERDQQMKMMLAGIAHEVRNPLGGMELFCGLLKEDLRSSAPVEETQKKIEKVERIEREINYLERLVESFLDFAGSTELSRERIDGADFIDEVIEVVDVDLSAVSCRVQTEVEEAVQLTVDRGRMRRALINVIRNACQASAQDGDVIVIRCLSSEAGRRIEVEDSGRGIAEDDLEQLCQPFYTDREQGSGLGLALTRQIVEEHGGTLEIESRLGEGTTVRFELPFDEAVKTTREEPQQQAIPEGWLG